MTVICISHPKINCHNFFVVASGSIIFAVTNDIMKTLVQIIIFFPAAIQYVVLNYFRMWMMLEGIFKYQVRFIHSMELQSTIFNRLGNEMHPKICWKRLMICQKMKNVRNCLYNCSQIVDNIYNVQCIWDACTVACKIK